MRNDQKFKSVSINEALLEHSRSHSLGCCLWLLLAINSRLYDHKAQSINCLALYRSSLPPSHPDKCILSSDATIKLSKAINQISFHVARCSAASGLAELLHLRSL